MPLTQRHARRRALTCAAAGVVLVVASACTSGQSTATRSSATTSQTTSPTASASAAPSPTTNPTSSPAVTAQPTATASATGQPLAVPAGTGPVIVLDPGHSPQVTAIDPVTGLNVSDYENDPEMADVYAVAQLVGAALTNAGYRVVMTKTSETARVNLAQRAAIANTAQATLAISIHDQAGRSGGINFNAGNNTVYYQSVGGYRATSTGKHVTFTDSAVAAQSQSCGEIFQARRAAAEGHSVALQGEVGYDLGTRGLAPGNMWMVQLLSRVPWIYNEAGGNSAGQIGLSASDKSRYAAGLVTSIKGCVPVTKS